MDVGERTVDPARKPPGARPEQQGQDRLSRRVRQLVGRLVVADGGERGRPARRNLQRPGEAVGTHDAGDARRRGHAREKRDQRIADRRRLDAPVCDVEDDRVCVPTLSREVLLEQIGRALGLGAGKAVLGDGVRPDRASDDGQHDGERHLCDREAAAMGHATPSETQHHPARPRSTLLAAHPDPSQVSEANASASIRRCPVATETPAHPRPACLCVAHPQTDNADRLRQDRDRSSTMNAA